jgi:hypothetical protein
MMRDAKNELVDFLVRRAFYPVLMAPRNGPDKSKIDHVQNATRAEIDRFRSYESAEEVVLNFKRDLYSKPAKKINAELRALNLPVINDLQDEFERKALELGIGK